MADNPKDICKNCGHSREDHKKVSKRSNIKKRRERGVHPKDTYDHTFLHCPGFIAEDKT